MGTESGGRSDESSTVDDTQRELAQVQRAVQVLRNDLHRVEAESAGAKSTAVVVVLGCATLLLLATTWLVPSGTYTQAAHFFADARTGLGMLDGPWQSTESGREWIGKIALLGYIVSAITVLASASSGRWVSTVASCVGLASTVAVLAAKPGDVDATDWEYAWQAPPYLACGFWLGLIAFTGSRIQRQD